MRNHWTVEMLGTTLVSWKSVEMGSPRQYSTGPETTIVAVGCGTRAAVTAKRLADSHPLRVWLA